MSTSKPDPKWLLIQKVVAFLEKTLTPEAEVLHDQKLSNITTGDKCQCDVVVKYGKPPRQSIAIVEVQKRNKRVEIGTLRNWWQKRHDVGAEKLICVSALDYPKTVQRTVTQQYGGCVHLLTLRDVEQPDWPFGAAFQDFEMRVPIAKGIPGERVGLRYGDGPLGPGSQTAISEQKLFKEGCSSPSTIMELVEEHLQRRNKPVPFGPGTWRGKLRVDVGARIWTEYKGTRQEVLDLEVPLDIQVHVASIPSTRASYEQVNIDGSIAWVAYSTATIAGEHFQIMLTIVPEKDGSYRIMPSISGRGGYLIIPLQNARLPPLKN